MDTPFSSMRDLARRVLAASQSASDAQVHEAAAASEKLRIPLTRFAGTEGFASLLRRAVALAGPEVPSLQNIKVSAQGRLEGFEQLAPDAGSAAGGGGSKAAVAIIAHLLGLLATFIGESLTMRLVREAWPDVAADEHLSRNRG